MYRRIVTPSAKKSLKRLPRGVQEKLFTESEKLEIFPYEGKRLHGSLSFLYSFHFSHTGVQYRIAYSIDEAQKMIIIHYTGPRENFYVRLRRLFHA